MSEKKRQDNVRGKILNALRGAGKLGVTNVQLSKIAVRYGGHLGELYKRGYDIPSENLGDGIVNYVLVSEPDKERLDHKRALDILLEAVDTQGSVSRSELSWLLDELNLNVKRKANTYKKGALV